MMIRQRPVEVPVMFRTKVPPRAPPRIRTGREHQARATIAAALANLRKSERERNRLMAEGTVAADELRLLIERIERFEGDKKELSLDVKDVYAEAKSRGYCTKTMRKVVALRKMETHDRQEADALLETYRDALGMGSGGSGYVRSTPRVSKVPTPLEEAIGKTDDLDELATKVVENGGRVESGNLIIPLTDNAREAAAKPN